VLIGLKAILFFIINGIKREMGGKEVEREGWRGNLAISNRVVEKFLTHLAVEENVAASTQIQNSGGHGWRMRFANVRCSYRLKTQL
jgi:hypothetical protein